MADEPNTAVAEPEAPPPTTLKDFGDLAEVFDKVFPSTAEKKEEAPPPPAEPEAKAPEPPPEPKAKEQPEPAKMDELPGFLTGKKEEEKPPVAPEPDPNVPAPQPNEAKALTNLRNAYYKLKGQLQEKERDYSTQIEELKKVPQTAPDADAVIKQLENQVQELSAAVERTGIEFHPGFRREFVDKREQLVNNAHQVLTNAKVDPVQWDRAMALTGQARTEALEEIYSDLPKSVSSRLGAAEWEIDALDSRRDAFLADRKGLRERLEQENSRQQREALKEHETNTLQMLDHAEKDLIERMGMEVYRKSDNPEHKKWNDSVDKMKEDARRLLLETTDPSVMARAALMAPAAFQYRYLYHVMRDRWLESEKRNKAVEQAEPELKTRGETPPPGDDKVSFADAVAKSVFSQ